MKGSIFYVFILSVFVLLNGCAGTLVEVSLTDLNPGLAEFQGDSVYDNVTNRVSYSTYGVEKYDNLFKEAAFTSATLSQLRFSLERVVGDSVRFPEGAQSAKFGIGMVKMAKVQVPELVGRVKSIVSNAMDLNPASDFGGPAMLKAPAVAKSLQGALSDMGSASSDLVQIGKLMLRAAKVVAPAKKVQAKVSATEPRPESSPSQPVSRISTGGKGDLYVTASREGASVSIDGSSVGVTPLFLEGFPIGQHLIQVKSGNYSGTQKIDLLLNEIKKVQIDLQVGKNSLKVLSEPMGANVYMDGGAVSAGETPTRIENLDCGDHQMVLRKEGYPVVTQSVNVSCSRETTVRLALVETPVEPQAVPAPQVAPALQAVAAFQVKVVPPVEAVSAPPPSVAKLDLTEEPQGESRTMNAEVPEDALPAMEERPNSSGLRKVAIALAVLAASSGGAGVYFNSKLASAQSQWDDANTYNDPYGIEAAKTKIQDESFRRNVAYGISLPALIGAVVLWGMGD